MPLCGGGYCLTGDTREHALAFFCGSGGNGKTTFLNVVLKVLKEHACVAAMDAFTSSLSDRHSTDLAMMHGARMVTASETEANRAWAESRIKALTGGDPIKPRFIKRENSTSTPTFKLTAVATHNPLL